MVLSVCIILHCRGQRLTAYSLMDTCAYSIFPVLTLHNHGAVVTTEVGRSVVWATPSVTA